MRRLRLLIEQLRHTRPSQAVDRARLLAKRYAASSIARAVPLPGDRRPAPPRASDPPHPLFPPRVEALADRLGVPTALVPGLEVPLAPSPDWHPAAASPLAHLALHYMEFLEAVDDGAFVRLVEDWIERNPPYMPRYWEHAWSAYAVSIRSVVWMQQIARRTTLPEAFVAKASDALARQLRFLARNLETDIGGNHLLKNVKALLWASRFFRGGVAMRWGDLGARVLERELDEQFLSDGMHFERSPSYHAQVTADLVECRAVLAPGRLRGHLDEIIDRAAQVLSDLAHPDGFPSLFNDGGFHAAYAPAAVLAVWAHESGRPAPSPRSVFGLENAGFYGARAGSTLLVVDCGPLAPDHLPAHGHGDAFAFEWSVAGARLVVDAGVHEYTAGPMRDYSRSTKAHNTVTVADADQAQFSGSFRMARRARIERTAWEPRADGFVLEGRHDGFAVLDGAPMHRRRFEASALALRVEDEVSGGAGQPVHARVLLHPEASLERHGAAAVVVARGPARLRIEASAAIGVEDAWFCPDFVVKLPAKRLVVEYGAAPVEGWMRLEVV